MNTDKFAINWKNFFSNPTSAQVCFWPKTSSIFKITITWRDFNVIL